MVCNCEVLPATANTLHNETTDKLKPDKPGAKGGQAAKKQMGEAVRGQKEGPKNRGGQANRLWAKGRQMKTGLNVKFKFS